MEPLQPRKGVEASDSLDLHLNASQCMKEILILQQQAYISPLCKVCKAKAQTYM